MPFNIKLAVVSATNKWTVIWHFMHGDGGDGFGARFEFEIEFENGGKGWQFEFVWVTRLVFGFVYWYWGDGIKSIEKVFKGIYYIESKKFIIFIYYLINAQGNNVYS